MNRATLKNQFRTWISIILLMLALSVSLFAQGKNPVIFIPGLTGSELIHKVTGEKFWVKALRSNTEDLRLPISADITKNRDKLVPGDILRDVKIGIFPITDVYGGFIKAMELRGGYHEESWDAPSDTGYQDSLYVFPYDWRLDNVENARLLIRDIEALKRKLKKPDLKFDIVAHSMGGIISRYAAMYGDADLPTGTRKPVPTWAGAKHFDKIILLGTPNEGSANSFGSLLNGFALGGLRIELPFIQDTSKFTVFTIPAAYQLLPAPGTLRAFDDKLAPMTIDIYDPKVWSKYGWNAIDDKDFAGAFNVAERKAAPAFFAMALNRAKRLFAALAAGTGKTDSVSFFILGSDCKTATDAIVVYRDDKINKWKTLVKPKGFTRSDGTKVTEEELKAVMLSPGDGVVSTRSLEAADQTDIVKSSPGKFICEDHNKLPSNVKVQDYIIRVLNDSEVLLKDKL